MDSAAQRRRLVRATSAVVTPGADGGATARVAGSTVELSPLANLLVERVLSVGETTLEDLAQHLVEEVGEPAPPLTSIEVTWQHVVDLTAHGVVDITDPDDPTSSVATQADAHRAVVDALTGLLGGGPWTVAEPLTPAEAVTAASRQRVGAQLASGLDRFDGPDLVRARLAAASHQLTAASLPVVDDLGRALDALEEAGLRALLFKGMALAAQAWGDPMARGYGDLDLLVAPADLPRAIDALLTDGWTHALPYPEIGPSWGWRHFTRTNYEMALQRGSSSLDLHWHPSPARSAFPDFDTLWARRATVEIGGRPVATFSAYDALAHSASHSAKDHWRWLRGLADVHRLMSLPETWRAADRPLRGDQLLTVGLASLTFGRPAGAPAVVAQAERAAGRFAERARQEQLSPERIARLSKVEVVVRNLSPLWHGSAGWADLGHRLSSIVFTAPVLAQETSPHAWVAAPRALARRTAEVARRGR